MGTSQDSLRKRTKNTQKIGGAMTKKIRNDDMMELTDRFYFGDKSLLEIENSLTDGCCKGDTVCIMGEFYLVERVVSYPELGIVDYILC